MTAVLSTFSWAKKSISVLLFAFLLTCGNAWSVVVQNRISTGNDDVEERISDGDMYYVSSDLEMAHDDYVGGRQIVGLRFQGVNIPSGATINSAYVEFDADRSHTGNTQLVISGESTGNAASFDALQFVGRRNKTTASVNWDPGSWSDNNLYQTPDLSSIVKEIVDLGGWSSGNDMVIMIEPGTGCSDSDCRRRAESYDGSRNRAPLLVVDYTEALLPPVSSVGGSCGTDNLIVVEYASTASDDALNVSNYTLSSGNITGITRQDDKTVVLMTDGLVGGQTYTLTVQNSSHQVSFAGLMGSYYDQRNIIGLKQRRDYFRGNLFLRLDSQVDFNWGTGAPTVFPTSLGYRDDFSIRWTGYIVPTQAGSYSFRTRSDDGIRVALEGVDIISNWSDHAPRYDTSGSQALDSDGSYEISMEFYERGGGAVAQLEWSRDGGSWEAIPTANLSTCPIPSVTPLPPSVLEFRMDEISWNGAADEVIDSSGNNNHAIARGGLTTVDPGQICRAGDFDGVDDYIETNDIYASLRGTSSMSFWIKTTQTGDDTGWRAPGIAGIEQSGGSDDIFWGWLDASGRIGISVANDFSTKSTIAINDDVYHHVVLTRDATSGEYKIYIDGVLNNSGTLTTGIIGNSFSSIGRIEDTGGTPEYFRGDLDEVKVFDSVLSDSDVTTLFNETRACPPTNACAASFPDGINSHDNGLIDFGFQTQLFSSPDGVLDAGSVVRNGGALTTLTCDYVDCSASGGAVPKLNPGGFPIFSSTQNISVSSTQTKVLGDEGNTDTYNNISVSGTLNVSSTYSEYFIKNMNLGFSGVLNLAEGDYWIETLTTGSQATINVVGGGTARLFVKNAITVGFQTRVNSPSNNTSGSPEDLLIFAYDNVRFGSQSTTSAVVYAKGNITLDSPSYVFGALTGSNVNLNSNSQVTYDANAISAIDLGGACGGSPSCSLGSFAITQPTYGLACPSARAPISIQALCVGGSSIKTDYTGTIDLSSDENLQSEFYLASSGGTAVNSVTLNSSDSGEVDVYLFHKNENPDLKVTAEDSVLSINSVATTGTDFRTSGFRVDRPADFDTNFVCGTSKQFTITAIGQDTSGGGSCNTLTGFTGTKALKAWADISIDPLAPNTKNTGLPKSILFNGSAVAETSATSNNVSANFSAGVANVTVEYLDVGNVIDLSFVHDDAPYDGSTTPPFSPLNGSVGTFVVKPDSVQIAADDAAAACSPLSANCTLFRKAGLPFSTTARAVCVAPNNVTAPSYRGAVSLEHQLVLPTPSAGNKGSLAVTTIVFDGSSSVAGEEVEANQKISEVGIFSIKTKPPAYFGKTVTEYDSEDIGRFYPHHFDVSISGGAFDNQCSATFTYMDQPFQFAVGNAPQVTITAQNADNDTTLNYEGDFWKLGASLSQTSSCNGGTGTIKGFCYEDAVLGDALFQPTVLTQPYPDTTNAQGQIVFDLHDSVATTAAFEYSRPVTAGSRVSPFDADVKLTIDLEDGDAVQGGIVKEHIGFVGESDSGVSLNTTNDQYLRYGRWVLENAFGPETESLKIPMSAEFYNGSNFVTNTDDDCSTYNATDMRVAPNLKNSGTTSPSGSGVAISGLAPLSNQIELSAPGDGKDGIAELCLDVERWLKFDWNNDGLDLGQVCDTTGTPTMGDNDNPMSTATFGRYRGHDRIIYWREISN